MSKLLNNILKSQTSVSSELPSLRYHVTEQIVNYQDKRLVAVIRLSGIPFETIPEATLQGRFDQLNVKFANSCKEKSGRLGIWTNVLRRKANNDFDYEFNNYFTNRLSEKYLKRFKGKNYFTNSYYISLVLRYEHDLEDAIAELEQLIQNYMIGFSIYEPSVLSAYKLIEGREIVKPEIDPDDDEDDIAEKKRLLDLYENQGVLYSQVFEFWSELLGREKKRIPVLGYPATELISNTNLHFGYEVLEIRSESKTVYASNYDLKAYPEECELGLFDNAILSLPVEFTLTQSFTSLTNTAAIDLIDQQLNKLQSVGDSATHQTDDIKNAKAYIQTGELALGQFHAAITVFGDSQKQAIMNGVAVSNSFINSGGIIWTKSTLSAPYTFFSQMPSAGFLPRPMPKSTRNLASTFSLHNFSVGKESGNPIADGSAVIPLQTDSSSLYNFNFHYSAPNRDNKGEKIAGHSLLLGATGTGKTTTQSTFISFFDRFGGQIFAIDKDRGMEILIRALGGDYFPLKAGEDLGIAPFQFPDSPKLRDFLYSLVECCAREQGKDSVSAEDSLMIKSAVDSVFEMEMEDRVFSALLQSIPKGSLHTRLSQWCHSENGRFAWALDSQTNSFDPLSFDKVGFDLTDLLKPNYLPTEPVISCLFYLKGLMKGKLLATIVEEFWLPAKYKITSEQILDVLKTGRKRLEFILLISQSPEDATEIEIFPAIVQQTPTKLFLPNPDADWEGYKKCGLSYKEFSIVKEMPLECRKFLIKQGKQSAIAKMDLYGMGDEIAVLSGSDDNIKVLEALFAKLPEAAKKQPETWLPLFHKSRKDLSFLNNFKFDNDNLVV
ncbi:hypothetical protein [Acinetobacter baumannii]|uniref:VirB4 family type IV secretion/conjugal transfer ATPase n=1 Tax=Acinetobacter baumannii TaxID=470 RepID=UPI0023403B71|nr:hypothetical protein [Acinetobacter baumannii]MDC4147471.1 hypothetical protein [Acinetobacter baumannii]